MDRGALERKSLQHSSYLDHQQTFIDELEWDTCVACGEDERWCKEYSKGGGTGWVHEFEPLEKFLEYDNQHKVLMYVSTDAGFSAPAANFYNSELDKANGHLQPPMDCRSCEYYLTARCSPLRNAIDDMENIIYNIQDRTARQKDYKLSPCSEFRMTDHMGFPSREAMMKWGLDMECTYGFNLISRLRWSTGVVGTYYYEDIREEQNPKLNLIRK